MTETQVIKAELRNVRATFESLLDALNEKEVNGWKVRYPRPLELQNFLDFAVAESSADNREAMSLPAWGSMFVAVAEGSVSINDRHVMRSGQSELILSFDDTAYVRALEHPTRIIFIAVHEGADRGQDGSRGNTEIDSANRKA